MRRRPCPTAPVEFAVYLTPCRPRGIDPDQPRAACVARLAHRAGTPTFRDRSMQFPESFRRDIRRTAETLVIATLGGIAMSATGFPAGLVTGSMLAVACAALLGRPMTVMLPLARTSFVLVGVLLGAVVTP